ncbi:hypothetical protein GGR73_001740 [Xanthomonas sp. F14]
MNYIGIIFPLVLALAGCDYGPSVEQADINLAIHQALVRVGECGSVESCQKASRVFWERDGKGVYYSIYGVSSKRKIEFVCREVEEAKRESKVNYKLNLYFFSESKIQSLDKVIYPTPIYIKEL